MGGERAAIFEWAREGRLAVGDLPAALRLGGVTPNATRWRQFIDRLLLGLGVVMLSAGGVFFVAFNWQDLGRFVKFALAELPVVVAIAICWRFGLESTVGRSALVAAALLTGALLALVGQVYQTGADTYELFAVWALAITAWVAVSRFPAMWLLWLALLHVALLLYLRTFETLFTFPVKPRDLLWLVFALDTAALVAWEAFAASGVAWLRARWAIRTLAFASAFSVTALALWSGVASHADRWPLAVYAAWMAAVWWAYRRRSVDLFVLASAVLSLIVVTTPLAWRLLSLRGSAFSFLLIGLMVAAGATLGAWWLRGIAAGSRT